MRFVCDEEGLGIEVAGLTGPEVVYLARKPDYGVAQCPDHLVVDLDQVSGVRVGIGREFAGQPLEHLRVPGEGPSQ